MNSEYKLSRMLVVKYYFPTIKKIADKNQAGFQAICALNLERN